MSNPLSPADLLSLASLFFFLAAPAERRAFDRPGQLYVSAKNEKKEKWLVSSRPLSRSLLVYVELISLTNTVPLSHFLLPVFRWTFFFGRRRFFKRR